MGHLSVTIATPDEELALDADSIMPRVESIGGKLAVKLLPLVKLAEWGQTRTQGEFVVLTPPPADNAQKWSNDLVPADVVQHIRQSFAQRQPVALRVPMAVQSRTNGPQPTSFKVFLERTQEDSEKPVFIRDELIISAVKSPSISQVRSLVIVEDGPLATLLRDAETPAHTEWSPATGNFKDKYKFGPGAINFVRLSVSEMLRIVHQAEQQPDPTITIDFFSIPAPPDEHDAVPTRRRVPSKDGAGMEEIELEIKNRRPKRFRIEQLRGGFRLLNGDAAIEPPLRLRVRVAYDVRRGNPLTQFHPEDIDAKTLTTNATDRSVVVDCIRAKEEDKKKGLLVEVTIQKPEFRLDCSGFDPNRDLYVKGDEIPGSKDGGDIKETSDGY
jgi:hypothetical protein